ncbi:PA2169 family four-helix-bundle protein [Haloferula chungangensis]|uniref:PA2169 family four-helix-bundle protein n=1 Tax=Haloferula chungangensis TaxID=1048331 RepID=A0ABW2L855_9BACT
MNSTIFSDATVPPNDAPELQEVLTRYADSRDGYHQAAELIDHDGLAREFRRIAARRTRVIEQLETAILVQGKKPDSEGSTEAKLHRWWIEMRTGMSDDELSAVLSECLRGELELERTIASARDDSHVMPEHRPLLSEAAEESKSTATELDTLLKAL